MNAATTGLLTSRLESETALFDDIENNFSALTIPQEPALIEQVTGSNENSPNRRTIVGGNAPPQRKEPTFEDSALANAIDLPLSIESSKLDLGVSDSSSQNWAALSPQNISANAIDLPLKSEAAGAMLKSTMLHQVPKNEDKRESASEPRIPSFDDGSRPSQQELSDDDIADFFS